MWNGQTICVILPTYNEKDSIRKCIQDFAALGVVDRVLVINNNAAPGTSEEVAKTSAVEVLEPVQGYGAAIQRGLRESHEDLVAVCEPDDTFVASDLFKFLAYIGDVDVVFGSRTIKYFIWEGANMGWFLKTGNWAVAKLMQSLYNSNSLSDVGCTFRLLRRSAVEQMLPDFRVRSNFFGPEMMLLTKWKGLRFIQIPVNYRTRIGESSVTGSHRRAFLLGLQMIWLILTFWMRGYPRR
jgi:glycosyltransferase involved in cell wall biosynthesis